MPTPGRKGTHRTAWEDGRMAGVQCDGRDAGTISADEDGDEPFVCDYCGAVLRLVWDVRLEEQPSA